MEVVETNNVPLRVTTQPVKSHATGGTTAKVRASRRKPLPPKLTIDREFHRLIYPIPSIENFADENLVNRTRVLRREWMTRRRLRMQQVEARLGHLKEVDPFDVWINENGKRTIVDGREDVYKVAVRGGFDIRIRELVFESRDHARAYLISKVLIGDGRPQYDMYYRIVLASKCHFILDLTQTARKRQGARTDLLQPSCKMSPINTTKSIGEIADCSHESVRKAMAMEASGQFYLQHDWPDIRNALITGDMRIGQAWKKYTDAEEEFDKLSEFEKKKRGTPPKRRRTKSKKNSAGNVGGILKSYTNPDLDEAGFENVIYCGDAAETLRLLPADRADLVFGSVHYNVPVEYHGTDYRKPHQQWLEDDIGAVVIEAARILRKGGRLVLNVADTYDPEAGDAEQVTKPILADVINLIKDFSEIHDLSLIYRETKIWIKQYRQRGHPRGSHNPSDPVNDIKHEYLIVFSHQSRKLEPPTQDTPCGFTTDWYNKYAKSFWTIAPASSSKAGHPCPFPEPLAERVIKFYSWPGGLVIDPWVGSGTTAAVAARNGRRWFGIDVDGDWCDHAAERTQRAHVQWLKDMKTVDDLKNDTSSVTEDCTPSADERNDDQHGLFATAMSKQTT